MQRLIESLPPSAAEVDLDEDKRWWQFWRGNDIFLRFGGACACDLLTDQADWDAATWDLKQEALTPLAEAVKLITSMGPKGLVVEAFWGGDNSKETVEVTPDELAEIILKNQLRTRTSYAVKTD